MISPQPGGEAGRETQGCLPHQIAQPPPLPPDVGMHVQRQIRDNLVDYLQAARLRQVTHRAGRVEVDVTDRGGDIVQGQPQGVFEGYLDKHVVGDTG